jgi:hypothetical protein
MRYEKINYQWPMAEETFLIVIHPFSLLNYGNDQCNSVKNASISSFSNKYIPSAQRIFPVTI